MKRHCRTYAWIMMAASGLRGVHGSAQSTDATVLLKSRILADGLVRPTVIANSPGDHARLFIGELGTAPNPAAANVRILDLVNESLLPEPYLTISVVSGGEQGLLGLAFDPDYSDNGSVYVHGSSPDPRGSRIARFTVSANLNRVDPESETEVFFEAQSDSVHQGGWMDFGRDGMLYTSIGDLGLDGNAQLFTNVFGKILRIDVSDLPYTIPPTNPFVGVPGTRGEIWALGLRNPWRCAFDRDTGDLWIGDVGPANYEEINLHPAMIPPRGEPINFGWPCAIGPGSSCAPGIEVTAPIHHWNYMPLIGDYVVGGHVYRGTAMPWLRGAYFFWRRGDHSVWSLRYDNGQVTDLINWTDALATPAGSLQYVVTFGEDAAGEIYVAEFNAGRVHRIEPRCRANCDGSTEPVLDVADLLCFMNLFAAGDPYACDCDTSTGLAVCDIFDFLCFGNAFSEGCP